MSSQNRWFLTPSPLLVVFLLSKIGNFWPLPCPPPLRRHSLWTAPNRCTGPNRNRYISYFWKLVLNFALQPGFDDSAMSDNPEFTKQNLTICCLYHWPLFYNMQYVILVHHYCDLPPSYLWLSCHTTVWRNFNL